MGHSRADVFRKSYLSKIAQVNVQDLFHGRDNIQTEHIRMFTSIQHGRCQGMPTKLTKEQL
jgi:hypothetical protein